MGFWTRLDDLISVSEVVIDRPKGSAHPRYPDILYPLDYGYLKETSGGDNNEIDVWRGSMANPRLVAIVCTIDTVKRDTEVKLLLGCNDDEVDTICRFHNGPHQSAIVVRRDG